MKGVRTLVRPTDRLMAAQQTKGRFTDSVSSPQTHQRGPGCGTWEFTSREQLNQILMICDCRWSIPINDTPIRSSAGRQRAVP